MKNSVTNVTIYGRYCSSESRQLSGKNGSYIRNTVRVETEPGRSVQVTLPRDFDISKFSKCTYDNYVHLTGHIVPGEYDRPTVIFDTVEIE